MGLTDDQKAMLRLLAQREQGYEDIAALLGISADEVRERVKEALAEVEQPDEAPPPAKEAPSAPEPAVTPPSPVPEPPPVEPPETQSSTAPAAASRLPTPPEPTPPASPKRRPSPRAPALPKNRGALIGLGAGALAVIALAIVLVVSGGEGESGAGPTAGESDLVQNASSSPESKDLTQAILEPIAGGNGRGRALFGRFEKDVLLQVEAEGLEPSPHGQAYTIWLYRTPKLALQIGAVPVGASGKIAAQFKIPTQLLAYVANGAFNQIDVSLTPTAAYRAALAKAKAESKLPPHIGTSVLRGEITGPSIR